MQGFTVQALRLVYSVVLILFILALPLMMLESNVKVLMHFAILYYFVYTFFCNSSLFKW